MTITLPNPSRTAAAKTTIRMRKPHPVTQALIDWHLATHTGDFTDCQEDVCILVDDHRHTHHCTCTAVKGGPATRYDNKTCLLCNDDLWLGNISPVTILTIVRRIHETDNHPEAHMFCDLEPCFTIERLQFVAGSASAPKLRR
jgi:hypothetical protein